MKCRLCVKGWKPGDKVRCLFREFGNETKGKIYIVANEYPPDEGFFKVVADDRGTWNYYRIENFELVKD